MNREMIKHIMEKAGHSKKQFAKTISINSATVDKWLSGSFKPSAESQDKIRTEYKREIAKLYK